MGEVEIKQTRTFARSIKKLHPHEKTALDDAVKEIILDPFVGVMKIGDLAGIQVFKYKHNTNEYLIAYEFTNDDLLLTLVSFGSHENFYRDLKKNV